MLTLMDVEVAGKRVMVREDFNVPLQDGVITNDMRIQAAILTIKSLLADNAAVILLSHLGRPKAGSYDVAYSLAPVAAALSKALNIKVRLQKQWLDGIDIAPGEVVLCENVRFNEGEKTNDAALAHTMASLCDVFVMDAFGSSHRAHASTVGVAEQAPVACAGPLLVAEIEALTRALTKPVAPVTAIAGGAKISTKLTMLRNLLAKVDCLIVGGGIANTLLAAKGIAIGKSLYEPDLVQEAETLLTYAEQHDKTILLPTDVVVAKTFAATATAEIKTVDALDKDDMILDFGPQSSQVLVDQLLQSKTILWNGPVGVFEFDSFAEGTHAIANAIAASDAFSIAGGGDTLAAIDKFGVRDQVSYISTGGGAFLQFLEGKPLPAVAILELRARHASL